jgi:hypothetical protein
VSTAALVVLGAGLSQRPLIRRAKERGLMTCVVDGRTDRPAAADADIFVHQDFSDVPATIAALEAAGVEAVGICSMGSEQAVVPGARLAEALASRPRRTLEHPRRAAVLVPVIDDGGPLRLLLTRRTWTRGVPITMVRCLHPASRYRLGSRFRADGNPTYS